MENNERRISFTLRVIHNLTRAVIFQSGFHSGKGAPSQLQGGILGYLYHLRDQPVYQKDIEKEFRISRATATNTLQVMEKNNLIVRKSQDKDARLKRIFMTEEAEANHARVEAHMAMMDERMLEGLTDREVSDLNRYLKTIMGNLERLRQEYSSAEDKIE